VRFAELDRWVSEEDYEAILAGEYPRREDDPQVSVSEEIKAGAKSYQDSWNRTSDPFVGLVKGFAEGAAGAGASLFSGLFGRPPGGGPGNGGSGSGSGSSGSDSD
jgi:hypothetical protein